MPAPPKTTDAKIVKAVRRLLEQRGLDGFSMNDVADAVGVRAPSLYGRFKDRAALLNAVELQLCAELAELVGKTTVQNNPEATLMAQSHAIRSFAKKHPNCYSLLFDKRSTQTKEAIAARATALAALMSSLATLVGMDRAYVAARTLVPFLNGYISMELANAFRLGGDVDASFEDGVAAILRGLAKTK